MRNACHFEYLVSYKKIFYNLLEKSNASPWNADLGI